ncbi:MAG: NAD(P)/FAD-dependent oxidoreductase [Candidatus Methanomethylicaceae archaeon]
MVEDYDVVIIGGGPAGLGATIYSSRAGVSTLLLEGFMLGGRSLYARDIDNYPGFPDGISGNELAMKLVRHAERFGAVIRVGESVTEMELCGKVKFVRTTNNEYRCRSVIIATGVRQKKLDIPGEEGLIGRGVSYCATCDGPFFRGKKVAVVGASEEALSDLIYLSSLTKNIIWIPNTDSVDEDAAKTVGARSIEILRGSRVVSVLGENKVTGLKLKGEDGKEVNLSLDGVFVAMGTAPFAEILKNAGLRMDKEGYIIINEDMETNLIGVYAAGDCTGKSHQIIVAVGQGAAAGIRASDYVKSITI